MVLVSAWKRVVAERYAQMSGRAGRAEFWWFALSNFIIVLVLAALSRASGFFLIIYVIYALALIVPSIAVSVRRLHDIGKSGWWIFIAAIPIVGGIILLVFHVMESQPGANAYGPPADPLPATA